MTVLNYRLPTHIEERIAAGLVGGPEFETRIWRSTSGIEERQGERSRPIRRWTLSLVLLRPSKAEVKELEAAFQVLRGQLYGFLFKAPGDWECHTLTYVDGDPYQAFTIPLIGGGTETVLRPLTRIISGSISGTYCQFLTPVRFAFDYWARRLDTLDLAGLDNVELIEILEDHA